MEEEEEKEGKVEKGEVEREKFVEKVQKKIANNFMAERKEEDVEKKGRESDRCPKARHTVGKSGRSLFLLLLLGQDWLCINAAAEDSQRRTGMLKKCSNRKFGKK